MINLSQLWAACGSGGGHGEGAGGGHPGAAGRLPPPAPPLPRRTGPGGGGQQRQAGRARRVRDQLVHNTLYLSITQRKFYLSNLPNLSIPTCQGHGAS